MVINVWRSAIIFYRNIIENKIGNEVIWFWSPKCKIKSFFQQETCFGYILETWNSRYIMNIYKFKVTYFFSLIFKSGSLLDSKKDRTKSIFYVKFILSEYGSYYSQSRRFRWCQELFVYRLPLLTFLNFPANCYGCWLACEDCGAI